MISIRKIGVIGRTYRHLNRYRQILATLFKYGFGDLVELLRIEQYIEIGLQLISKKRRERLEKLSRAQRVRMALEELGPTYIKLGQILSARPDLVPVDFVREFEKLQDKVVPVPFDKIKAIIEDELGQPLEEIFKAVDPVPRASASIGQVHEAWLASGEKVAVKVQRPAIEKIVEIDLEIMLHLATLMERHIEELAFHRPVTIVEEFARSIERELDYSIEASSMERVAAQFLANPKVYIPKVYRRLSTKKVLTTEFVDGIKINDLEALKTAGLDLEQLCDLGTEIVLAQVLEFGFFHADPHPGNIFALPDNVICLLDFGMMGAVDRSRREQFVDLIHSITRRDEARAAQILLRFTIWEEEPDLRRLEIDVADFIGRHLYKPLKDIEIGKLLQHLLEIAASHRMRIPPDIFLMFKALSTVEGVARTLNPDFDFISKARPFIKKVRLARLAPARVSSDMLKILENTYEFMVDFPKDLLEITRAIRQRKLSVTLVLKDMQTMLATHDQISNRIAFAIIIAALIIGSALIVISKTPPLFYGISLIGIIGFLAAAVMGIWLLVAIIKKGRL